MKADHGTWPTFTIWTPWSKLHGSISFKHQLYKTFGHLTRCKPNVDQEEWPCTQKWVCFFLNICPKRAYLEIKIKIKFDHSFVSSCLHLLFSPEKTPKNIIPIFLCHGVMDPCTFLLEHLFYLSHRKTRWTMSINNVGLKICLLRTSNSMVTLTFFSLV